MAVVAVAVVVGRTRLAMPRPLGADAVVLPVVVTVVCGVALVAVVAAFAVVCGVALVAIVAVAVVVGRTRLVMPRPRGAVAVVPPVVVTVVCGVALVAIVAAAVGVWRTRLSMPRLRNAGAVVPAACDPAVTRTHRPQLDSLPCSGRSSENVHRVRRRRGAPAPPRSACICPGVRVTCVRQCGTTGLAWTWPWSLPRPSPWKSAQ